MPDNPTTTFALAGHRVLALQGPDAVRFAHAQFMSDVAALTDLQWQWSGWLTPKGRVLALFALLRLDPQQLWLLLPDADPEALAAALRRFVFRSKVRIATRPDLAVAGAFSSHAAARGAGIARLGTEAVALDFGADEGPRTLSIAAPGDAAAAVADLPAAVEAWRRFDLAHGLPRLDEAGSDRWTPQQLSLDRLRAYSVKKGCYPGQEIVARTHFLGQAKRGLAALHAPAPVAVDAGVELAGARVGTIVSTARAEPCLMLAVLALDRGPGRLQAGGQALAGIALRDGLAR